MEKRRVNVRAIIWRGGKLLAVKFKNPDGTESDYWALPGGGLDLMESLELGIKREIIEETAIEPQVGRLLFGQQFKSKRPRHDEELEFFYHITNPEAYEAIDLAATTHGNTELARCEFIDPTKENILPELLSTINIENYVSSVQPVHIANYLD